MHICTADICFRPLLSIDRLKRQAKGRAVGRASARSQLLHLSFEKEVALFLFKHPVLLIFNCVSRGHNLNIKQTFISFKDIAKFGEF